MFQRIFEKPECAIFFGVSSVRFLDRLDQFGHLVSQYLLIQSRIHADSCVPGRVESAAVDMAAVVDVMIDLGSRLER